MVRQAVVCIVLLACAFGAPNYKAPYGLRGLVKTAYESLTNQTLAEFGKVPEDVDLPLLRRFIEAQLTREDVQMICKNFGNSLFGGISCETEEEGLTGAQAYLERYGMPAEADLAPIIFVPGLGGSGMEARIHKPESPAWYCSKRTAYYYQLWLALYEILVQPCWFDNLKIFFNPGNHSYSNENGVEIREKDWGGLSGVDYLDHVEDVLHLTTYFGSMIKEFEHLGFKAGVHLYGAPYDWRIDPSYLYAELWAQKFNALVVNAYTRAGNKKVHIITHSMGGPTTLYFLNRQSQEWKNKYIASFLPIAAPWSGSPKALRAMISGDNFGLHFLGLNLVNLHRIAVVARQAGGVAFLSPETAMWPRGYVFVETPARNYTGDDLEQLFEDLGSPVSKAVLNYTTGLMTELSHPQVPMWCLYGYNVNTEMHYVYKNFVRNGQMPDQPKIYEDDCGDGTVPLQSLQQCRKWDTTEYPVNCKDYNLREHSAILKDHEIILDLISAVMGRSNIHGCKISTVEGACNTKLAARSTTLRVD